MKILAHGKHKKDKKLRGTCQCCDCRVEVAYAETKTLIDRDTTDGGATQHVTCPECWNPFLWVK